MIRPGTPPEGEEPALQVEGSVHPLSLGSGEDRGIRNGDTVVFTRTESGTA